MAQEPRPRRGGLRSASANQARIQEGQRVEDAGLAQYEGDARAARAEADAGPSPNLNPRTAAAARGALGAAADRAEGRLAGARTAAAEGFGDGAMAGPAAPPAPAVSTPVAPMPRAPRPAPAPRRAAAPVTSEADKLNEISLALAKGQAGPQQPGTAAGNIGARMGYAQGGYVRHSPGWSFGGKSGSGAGSSRYSKKGC